MSPLSYIEDGIEVRAPAAQRTDVYQGHLADGSSIQKHSVGDIFPFVLQVRSRPEGGTRYYWELIGPGIESGTALRFESHAQAHAAALRLLAVREHVSAWQSELQRVLERPAKPFTSLGFPQGMQDVANCPAIFEALSKAQRVQQVLDAAGYFQPAVGHFTFVEFAASSVQS